MKKYFIIILALFVAAGIYGFSTKETLKDSTTLYWYQFIDIPGNDPDNPQHYERTPNGGTESPDCPTGTTKVCAVFAEPASPSDLEHPDLSAVDDTRMKQ